MPTMPFKRIIPISMMLKPTRKILNLATNAIESELLIEDNKADKSHASPVATHVIESSIPTEAN